MLRIRREIGGVFMELAAEIREELLRQREVAYQAFQARLIPSVSPESIIGVRTPILRGMARRLMHEDGIAGFLNALPHRYFEENQLHAFVVSGFGDFSDCVGAVNRFLPFVDNWATCDQMTPKIFRRHRAELKENIGEWLRSEKTYTLRFGVKMLMDHFLDEDFDPRCLEMAASVRSEEYYVNMMVAWFFATALAKQYRTALPYLEENRLSPRVHGMAVRKAVESFRITAEQKAYLKTLKTVAAAQPLE